MSDLERRNTEIMIAEAQRMHFEVEELRAHLLKTDLNITKLTAEVADLKKAQIMAAVNAQIDRHGHGGTV